ncbi:hypothetical protein AWW66_11345 [Micromonospora rosaria]|uniref:Amino acid adenylation domain-containing protein n=1 Tax=Micromonospora rosaria TaxID=47874 RepID=A0A136PTU4_9ACTN|nr:AMP-binding protein [Micromonospora rosaria]KXK61848.1 hypothetical protein AWW66_11345 [Micromonospora rosaria]
MTGSVSGGLATRVLARSRRHPDALAVVDGDRQLDYAALADCAAAVALGLWRLGVRRGQAVAVCLPRSWQLVGTMLGILRVGGVVVPLDAQNPAERSHHILTDAGCTMVVHDGTVPAGLPHRVTCAAADDLLATETGPTPDSTPADCSFLFYTSGTAGRPQGVQVRDGGILRLAEPGYLEFGAGRRFACLADPAVDALSFEVWVPLLTGGCCVIVADPVARTPRLLRAALLRERIDTVLVTTVLFAAVVAEEPACFAATDQVLVGGEQLDVSLVRRWYRDNPDSTTRLHHVYGRTECTTLALSHPIDREVTGEVVPIGLALPGTEALAVAGDRPAVPGEQAELYLGGEGVAAGYRNLPEETACRFVRLAWRAGRRYYRTGDLVRLDEDGTMVVVGRVDRQVTVCGCRVEPGEVERQILTHPGVLLAHVCARRDPVAGGTELLAYVVLRHEVPYGDYDRHLAHTLPPALRPRRTYRVDALPVTDDGTVDEAALLAAVGPPSRGEGDGVVVTAWRRLGEEHRPGLVGAVPGPDRDAAVGPPHGGEAPTAINQDGGTP